MGQTPWALSQIARTRSVGWYIGVERLLQRRLAELRLKIFLDRAADGGKKNGNEPLDTEQGDEEEIVTLVELKKLLQSEAITEKTLCWMQGFPDWCPIHSCREQLGLLDDGSEPVSLQSSEALTRKNRPSFLHIVARLTCDVKIRTHV